MFIELPNLPVGVHKLRFSFASGLTGEFARIDDRQAVICILEDRSYSSITDLRGPLSVQIDPPMPTMEQPWKVDSKSRFEDPKLGRSKAKCRSARMRRNKRSLPGDFPLSISRCPLMFGEYISEKISTTTHDGWSEMSSAKSDNFRNLRESEMWKTPLRSPYPLETRTRLRDDRSRLYRAPIFDRSTASFRRRPSLGRMMCGTRAPRSLVATPAVSKPRRITAGEPNLDQDRFAGPKT